jgi:hypothetical protein
MEVFSGNGAGFSRVSTRGAAERDTASAVTVDAAELVGAELATEPEDVVSVAVPDGVLTWSSS